MEFRRDIFSVSTDKQKLDIGFIHRELAGSYWAKDIPADTVKRSVENSLCFGLYADGKQIGFARVISDYATFGYLADVFVTESFRGRGLSKWLMEIIMDHPQLQGLRRFMLATKDAHGLYLKSGFKPLEFPERLMEITRPGMYSSGS
ncbi:MAG: N-acetyltransferase GCN5 [Bacteroidetes bacterium]|nr:MAG: N-acetyltransferase GCN5 [Bacteroidota bacterium]